jgi:CelD/BcsL family acetyltransferase involved in cellulose biosynthesis
MISLVPLPAESALKQLWVSLASQAPHSFFLSWHWIGTWLHCLGPSVQPRLLTVSSGATPVAAAILVKATVWRRHVLPVRTWSLNTTGQKDFDCVGMEYNGLLAAAMHEKLAWAEVVAYFLNHYKDWDEINLGGVSTALISAWADRGLPLRESRRDTSRYADLDAVRTAADQSCVKLLPSRARTRIRHTTASLQAKYGPLSLTIAQSREEAHSFLRELMALHSHKWAAHLSKGAFNLPFAERFHSALIDRHFDDQVIQLARVCVGPITLGVFYNFVYQRRVYFHQSGINYQATEKHESPGLLIHALLIDHNAALGHDVYDLLAGDSQYKRTLARESTELWWGALQAPHTKLQAERVVTRHYRSVLRWIPRFRK